MSQPSDAPKPSFTPVSSAAQVVPRDGEPADESLMERFGEGDAAAFEALFERHADRVHALLAGRVHDAARAEDLTRTTFLSLLRARSRYPRGSPLAPWLDAIADNVARDALRRGKPGVEVASGSASSASDAALRLGDGARSAIRLRALYELKLDPAAGSWRTPAVVLATGCVVVAGLLNLITPVSKNLSIGAPWLAWGFVALLALTQITAAWWAVRPALPQARLVVLALAVGVAALVVLMPGLSSSGVHAKARQPMCAVFELLAAFIPFSLGLVALRHTAPSALRGALVGAAAGGAGMLALWRHCSNVSPLHLGVFHLGAWALVVVLGALVGRVMRPRAFAP